MTLSDIERLTEAYATPYRALYDRLARLQAAVDDLQRAAQDDLRELVANAVIARADLANAIEAAPELFEKRRTQIYHGIKVGMTKQKGKVVIDDEAKTIERIRKQLPEEQAELLIRKTESVHKPAVYDLIASDLKRLGIRIEDDSDAVVIKAVDSAIEKAVAGLLKQVDPEQIAA